MISIADLNDLMTNPQVAYDGYDELRAAARRRTGGYGAPREIPLMSRVITRRGVDWCRSVLGKPFNGDLQSIPYTDAHMLLIADERNLDPAIPAWLTEWKAQSAEDQRRRNEAREAALQRDRDRWAAALAACGVEVEVRPNVNGRRYGRGAFGNEPLRHAIPLVDARSSKRRHPAGRALCEVRHLRTFGEPTGQPATCASCIKYTAEIRPVRSQPI